MPQSSLKLNSRCILKFTRYSFDGVIFKPRYVIILETSDEYIIYATVSTSQVLPHKYEIKDRKLKETGGKYWCFKFDQHDVVGFTNKKFSFPETCYVNVNQKPSVFLTSRSAFEKSCENNIMPMDILDKKIYGELLYVIYQSEYLPRKIKKLILPLLESQFGPLQ